MRMKKKIQVSSIEVKKIKLSQLTTMKKREKLSLLIKTSKITTIKEKEINHR
jgi:hypothetical protein